MKRFILSSLLCFILFAIVSPQAQALVADNYGYLYANQEMYEFWQTHGDELYKKYGISAVGQQEFHDGLLLVHSIYGQCGDLYVTRDAKVIDLNQDRFDRMFAFSDGLAAVNIGNLYGYINTEGTLVIPVQFPVVSIPDYGNQVGTFIGDTALVVGYYSKGWPYSDPDARNFSTLGTWDHYFSVDRRGDQPSKPSGLDYAYITRDGRMIGNVETIYEEQQALVFMTGRT